MDMIKRLDAKFMDAFRNSDPSLNKMSRVTGYTAAILGVVIAGVTLYKAFSLIYSLYKHVISFFM
jgi:hypothetical protein